VWADRHGDVEVRFVGRGEGGSREEILARVEASPPPLAALRQVHSDLAVEVDGPGFHGEADALHTARAGLGLSVITADCVPVLVAGRRRLVAIHAGWRGLASGVVPAGLALLDAEERAGARAWIGPAIGPCCYEVGDDVADAVAAASGREVVSPGTRGRPHLDVRRAAAIQLAGAGIGEVGTVGPCTRCHPDLLWSYRRDGKLAGRNVAYVWRNAGAAG
jgi:YfiH family protein